MTADRPPPGLERFTGYLMRRAYVAVTTLTERLMPDGVHVREAVLLELLDHGAPLSGRDIARLTWLNRSLVVKLVDAVEGQGWALRGRHERDRRCYALNLTPAGAAALPGLGRVLDEVDALFLDDLIPGERIRLHGLLTLLLDDDPVLGIRSLAGRSSFLVVRAHRALRERSGAEMAAIGLHPREFGALSMLADGPGCSQAELAARVGVSPPGVLGLVDDLEQRGLVDRVRSTVDRRVLELSLSDAGVGVLAAARRIAGGIQADLAARLGVEGDIELRDLLARVAAPACDR